MPAAIIATTSTTSSRRIGAVVRFVSSQPSDSSAGERLDISQNETNATAAAASPL